jgi:hypothetical protein
MSFCVEIDLASAYLFSLAESEVSDDNREGSTKPAEESHGRKNSLPRFPFVAPFF